MTFFRPSAALILVALSSSTASSAGPSRVRSTAAAFLASSRVVNLSHFAIFFFQSEYELDRCNSGGVLLLEEDMLAESE